MRFIEVDSIPKRMHRHSKKDIYSLLENFIKADIKYAKIIIDLDEYAMTEYCKVSIHNAIKRYKMPVTVKASNGVLYLVRTDKEVKV